MQLFYGEESDNGINWIPADKGSFMQADYNSYDDLSAFGCLSLVTILPTTTFLKSAALF